MVKALQHVNIKASEIEDSKKDMVKTINEIESELGILKGKKDGKSPKFAI